MSSTTVVGKVQNGKVVVEVPPDWPEGGEVWVIAIDQPKYDPADEPPEIAAEIARMEEAERNGEPWVMPEDLAARERRRAEDRAWRHARQAYENSLNPRPPE
jgi:hypothetical protein